jgi:GrpB-like predicted nucleotidyltransferase (UPF0157 family)
VLLGLQRGVVQLTSYRAEWVALFAQEKQRVLAAIGAHILDIQHVGSTSIPGMPAKPVLDIAVAVRSFEEAIVCIAPMEELAYRYRGQLGIPNRHYFVKGEPRTHQVHMLERHGTEWERMLLFRDFLCAHPPEAAEYAALKYRLAAAYPTDVEQHTNSKSAFIEDVIVRAKQGNLGVNS